MADKPIEVYVDEATGLVSFVHSDEAVALAAGLGGTPAIRRASHVEPDAEGRWVVDLSPVGGPTLGPYPAGEKQAALDAEVAWINANYLGRPAPPG